jgi:hypothetical protein
MATQPEDTKPGAADAPATPPRKTPDVAPETTAQAARQTQREVAPPAGAPEAPTPAKAPAKATGPSPESKRKAARSTSGAPRRGRTTRSPRTASPAAAAPRARATTRAGAARPRLTPPPAAAVALLPERVEEPAERAGHQLAGMVEVSRTAGRTVVDVVESTGDRLAAYHEQVAEAAPVSWVADLARANAGFTRAATRAYTGAARTLLRD